MAVLLFTQLGFQNSTISLLWGDKIGKEINCWIFTLRGVFSWVFKGTNI